MKKPKFEVALADIAERMNISTFELLQLAMEIRTQDSIEEFIEPNDEYIEAVYQKLEASENCHALDVIFNDIKRPSKNHT